MLPHVIGSRIRHVPQGEAAPSVGEPCIIGAKRLSGRELCDTLFVLAAARGFKRHAEVAQEARKSFLLYPATLNGTSQKQKVTVVE